MTKCTECGSYAINHHCHGRDGSDPELCDVCYWRKRASELEQARRTSEYWKASHLAGNTVIDQLRTEIEALQKVQKLREALETLVEHFEYYMGDNECRPLENARAALAAIATKEAV